MNESILAVLQRRILEARTLGHKEMVVQLSTILGDLQRIDHEFITHDQYVAYLKAALKSQLKAVEDSGGQYTPDPIYMLLIESELKQYQPKQLTAEELRLVILNIVANGINNKGLIMKTINSKFKGQFDNKEAANLVAEILKNSVAF